MATKKIKKVETPIDQRETFVSLQKNFADSEISVEEKLKTLYELQQADSEIDKILQLRGELPSEVEALENELADLKARQAQDAAVIDAYNQTIAENKQNIVDCDIQIEKYQQQLNDISNSREYDSINKEIENQGLLRQIALKTIGDTKTAIAEKKEDIDYLKDRLTIRTISRWFPSITAIPAEDVSTRSPHSVSSRSLPTRSSSSASTAAGS